MLNKWYDSHCPILTAAQELKIQLIINWLSPTPTSHYTHESSANTRRTTRKLITHHMQVDYSSHTSKSHATHAYTITLQVLCIVHTITYMYICEISHKKKLPFCLGPEWMGNSLIQTFTYTNERTSGIIQFPVRNLILLTQQLRLTKTAQIVAWICRNANKQGGLAGCLSHRDRHIHFYTKYTKHWVSYSLGPWKNTAKHQISPNW